MKKHVKMKMIPCGISVVFSDPGFIVDARKKLVMHKIDTAAYTTMKRKLNFNHTPRQKTG
jgi:hypothetical protein